MDLTLEVANEILRTQPFSTLLGARLTSFGDRAATIEMDIREELLQQNGYVHGGVLAYAADNAITFAGGSVIGPDVLTGGFSIDYLAAARGAKLLAQAQVVHASIRRATCRCDLYVVDSAGESALCAAAQGTVVAR
ncbi:MAG: PaaI family thioesterase [Jiangellaceae bacterium]